MNEVIEKLGDDDAILRLIEKMDLKDETFEKINDNYQNKKLIKMTSERLKSVLDVMDCDLEPLKYNELKLGGRYIVIFAGTGFIYMLDVIQINAESIIVRYLDSELLSAKTKWFINHGGYSGQYDKFSCDRNAFYEVKEKSIVKIEK